VLGFAPIKRTGWNFVVLGLMLALAALSVPGVQLTHKTLLALGLGAAGLVCVAIGLSVYRKRDPKKLIPLVAEAADLLNMDPRNLILPGEPKELDMALSALEMRVHLWRQDVMKALQESHATWSEISSFDLLGTYEPVAPWLSYKHGDIKGMLAARMERLRAIISQMETE
jgi:hypothetical protein